MYNYDQFNGIHNTGLPVKAQLPDWAAPVLVRGAVRLKKAQGRNEYQDIVTFTYCGRCGGWVPEPAYETHFAQPTAPGVVPARPRGISYYCPRCGTEIEFVED